MTTTTVDQMVYAAPRRRSTVRLTRRGRAVVFLAALVVLLGLGLLGAGIAGASGEKGAGVPTHTVVVGTGDTLWDLAADAADGGDIRAMEQTIKDLNGLDSGMLVSGQTLRIPS